VLVRSQDLTRRLMGYFQAVREEDSAELAALRRMAALHEVIQALAARPRESTFSLEG
jgi:hypothetical protein